MKIELAMKHIFTLITLLYVMLDVSYAQKISDRSYSVVGAKGFAAWEYSPFNEFLALTARDIFLLDTQNGTTLKTYFGVGETLSGISFSMKSRYLAAGSGGKTVLVWDMNSQERIFQDDIKTSDKNIPVVAGTSFLPNGELITVPMVGYAQKWDIVSKEETARAHIRGIAKYIQVSPNGKYLLIQNYQETEVFTIEPLQQILLLSFYFGGVISNDGISFFVLRSGSGQGFQVQEIDFETGEVLWSSDFLTNVPSSPVLDWQLSSNGELILIGNGESKKAQLYNVSEKSVIAELHYMDESGSGIYRFSPDSKSIQSISGNQLVSWDISDLTSRVSNAEHFDN